MPVAFAFLFWACAFCGVKTAKPSAIAIVDLCIFAPCKNHLYTEYKIYSDATECVKPMAAYAQKTVENDADIAVFVGAISDAGQRDDVLVLLDMLARISGMPPKMWGRSIIGYGTYHFRYESGREGDWMRIGFSPRKGKIVLYIIDGLADHVDILARLGKHKTGKACIDIKRLSDVDAAVLAELCAASLANMARQHPI